MIKKIITTILLSIFCNILFAQTINEIKSNHSIYLWGEGAGVTIKKADKEALAMLISQISTQVESSFTLLKDEMLQNGNSEEFNETFHSVIKTYSGATLKNTERIIIREEPDAKVLRYIKRDEIVKIFQDRKEKILGFVKNADKSIEKNQIADGLRYYYWALTLLKSHPDGANIEYVDDKGNNQLLVTWLPMQINNVFANININVAEQEIHDGYTTFILNINYNNIPITNFDYEYWNGSDYSNLVSARNGIGLVELYGISAKTDKIKIKAEYIFEGEARIDRELEDVLTKIDPIPFRNSYYSITAKVIETAKQPISMKADDAILTEVTNKYLYQKSIHKIINSIKLKEYSNAENEFTPEGYQIFTKLINYGNAKVLGMPELKYVIFNNKVICRSIPMSFNFKTNNKQFIENVVFHFNEKGKVENITFALSQIAVDDIVKRTNWKEYDRIILIDFLENYKTAYALKRINYIEQIFADDALIITGSVVKVKPNEQNRYKDNKIIKYNRQTKQQYIKNLKYSFNSKEYVNLEFEDSRIRKSGKGGDIYGIQIKQNYYSSNYGDEGYLFLLVDLNDTNNPIIHVRTWQPNVINNDGIYGLGDF